MPENRPPPRGVPPDPDAELSAALRAAGPRVHLLAAAVLTEMGALEAAWETMSRVAPTVDDPRLRAELGCQLLFLSRGFEGRMHRQAARDALQLAVQFVPRRAIPALARHLQREGALEEALALWEEAINLEPAEAEHRLRYGELLEAQKRGREAYAAYLRLVDELPCTRTALTVAPRLQRLAATLAPAPDTIIRIALLGSGTLDQLRDCLVVQGHRAGLRPEVHVTDADRYEQEIRDATSDLYRFDPEVLILAIHRSQLFPDLDAGPWPLGDQPRREAIRSCITRLRGLLRDFRAHSPALVLLHNIVVPAPPLRGMVNAEDELHHRDVFHQINLELARLVFGEFHDVHLVDEDAVQARCGKARATDPRLWLAAGVPWGESLLMPLAGEHVRHLVASRDSPRRCLIINLDNTLWGGRVDDDGASGVRLSTRPPGNAFLLFQEQLGRMRDRGILLAICSKATRELAVGLIETHPDMVMRPHDFAATRFGCHSKPDGVRDIAAELGLGPKDIVFWDPSPFERAEMRERLPGVLTPDVPADPAWRRQALTELAVFEVSGSGNARG
jgi:HAD superfamily phosphatase (TIGR01681 family)